MSQKKSKLLSRERRLNHLYKIVNTDKNLVTFRMNKAQRKLFEREKELRKLGKKVWIKILKARQLGFTTYKLVDKFDKVMFYSNVNVNIVAHEREKLTIIFDKVKLMYKNLPPTIRMSDGRIRHKPKPQYDNRNEYYFPANNSKIGVTLDSRSGTLSDCHITEASHISQFVEMLRGTIPSALNADITIETTANGMGEFKDFYDNDDRFEAMFFPRFDDEGYQSEAPEGYIPIKEIRYLQNKFNLTDNQMYWYETMYKADPDGTLQEYPSEPIDAFISSGRPFYNLKIVKSYNIIKGERDEGSVDRLKDIIWYNNKENHDALFGIDFSEGLDHGDDTVIRIRDRDLRLIATYKGKIDPGDVTDIIDYFYDCGIRGTIAPEVNNHGHTFIYASKDHARYEDIYIPIDNNKNDYEQQKAGRRGRVTNMVTRPIMLDEHKQLIKIGALEMDEDLQAQCMTFVVKNKKPQADTNCNDDVVLADAICCQMVKEPSRIIITRSVVRDMSSQL